jgi:gamma-glutamyl-gamma-aminobutyrate hydrolase PuuD
MRSSYVEYMQEAGAEVVPIILGEHNTTTMKYLVERLNGILMPGGSGSYYDFGKEIFDEVVA